MNKKKSEFKIADMTLIRSIFETKGPYNPELKDKSIVSISTDCMIDYTKGKKFILAFPMIEVKLIEKTTEEANKGSWFLSVEIGYFIAMEILSEEAKKKSINSLKKMIIEIIWPYFRKEVRDYSVKAGYFPIDIDFFSSI